MENHFALIQGQPLKDLLLRISNTVSAFREQNLVPQTFIDEKEAKIAFFNDFLNGFHKLTLLIQGGSQVGKTTILNCLLNDDIFPNFNLNCINIVQYDADCTEPRLYTARLKNIFNMSQGAFSIRPDQLRDTGMRGRDQIRTFFDRILTKEESGEERTRNQNVYVVRHKIEWLNVSIQQKFILDRIQFVDFNLTNQIQMDIETLQILQRLKASKYHYELLVLGGQHLFTEDVAQKYNDSQNEKSLVIINNTDTLVTSEHFGKIYQRLPTLSQVLGKSIEEIEQIIEANDETSEMKNEILRQSFLEQFSEPQENCNSIKPLYFLCGMNTIQKILIEKFENSDTDQEKALLDDLFTRRIGSHSAYTSMRQELAENNILFIQGFLNDRYMVDPLRSDHSLSHITDKIAQIASQELCDSISDVLNDIEAQRTKLLDYETYAINKLTETEIQDLSTLFDSHLSKLFLERSESVKENAAILFKEFDAHFSKFVSQVKELNPDYYVVELKHKRELLEIFENFTTRWNDSRKKFLDDSKRFESAIEKKIRDLREENKLRKHVYKYIQDNVEPKNEEFKNERLEFEKTISDLAKYIQKALKNVVDQDSSFLSQIAQFFVHYFNRNSKILAFEKRTEDLQSTFNELAHLLTHHYINDYLNKIQENHDNFESYKRNAPGFSIEKTREIVLQNLL